MDSALLHVLAVGALTADITFTMFTTIALDQPFGGNLRMGSEPFEMMLNDIVGDGSQQEA